MNRRAVALVLGLSVFLALLGSWFARINKEDAPPTQTLADNSNAPDAPIAQIVQVPRNDSKDGSTARYDAPLGPGVFRGRVIDAVTREPIREFTIELLPSVQRNEPAPRIEQSFRTNDGRFTYRGLPTGAWTIFTTAAGYQRFDIADARISESEASPEVLIPMRIGFSLRGRVFDESTSAGIAAATISFRETSTGPYEGDFRSRPSARSRKDGSFTLDGVPPGAIRLEVRAGGYVRRDVETFVSGKTPSVEIALSKGATVSGYLASTDGLTPVSGEATLANLDENTAMQISTGPAGEFAFFHLSAGRHRLTGRGRGLNGQREITLAPNEQFEGLVLPMTAGHSIRGVISGLRPEDRTETIVLVNAMNSATGITDQVTLDQRGAYEIGGVAPGQIAIEVISKRRGRLVRAVTMPADADLTIDFQFKSGARLAGRITRGGKPLAGAVLNISTSATDGGQYMHSTSTSNSGDYVAGDVPEGEYLLAVDSYNAANVRVAGDTVFDLEIPDAQLSGRVLEDGGNVPVVGATVDVRPVPLGSHTNRLMNRSDHFGQFAIRSLQPGDYMLTAYKPGYELHRAPISYGSPIADMVIHMRPARGIEIRVRDADSNKAIGSFFVVETDHGSSGLLLQLQADQNGVSYLPSGLSGSSLRIVAFNYVPTEIPSWNGQQLDLSLQRQASP